MIILNNDNKQYILDLIQQSNSLIVACLCAAWCDTCNSYQSAFKDLATKHTEYIFLWIDIEDNPEFLGDADIENFPTILIQNLNQTLFFGEQLPYIQHLKRLIENVASNRLPLVTNDAPPLIANILKAVN